MTMEKQPDGCNTVGFENRRKGPCEKLLEAGKTVKRIPGPSIKKCSSANTLILAQ